MCVLVGRLLSNGMTMRGTRFTSFSWQGNQLLHWFSNMLLTLTRTESSTGWEPMAGEGEGREDMFHNATSLFL